MTGYPIKIAADAGEPIVGIVRKECIRGGPEVEIFSGNIRLHIERYGAAKQPNVGIGHAAGGVQIVEGEN